MVITCSRRNDNRYFWFTLIAATIIGCALLIYISLAYFGEHHRFQPWRSRVSFSRQEKLTDEKCIPICDTRECISLAAFLLKSMDSVTDPCDNFDLFLCGGFKKRFGPEEHSSSVNVLQMEMSNNLRDILDNIQGEPESASSKMKTVYDSCIGSGVQTVQKFQSFLNELGIINWPNLAPDFQFAGTNLPTILGKLMVYFNFLFLLGPYEEEKDERTEILIKVGFCGPDKNPVLNVSSEALIRVLEYFDLSSKEIDTITKDYADFRNLLLNSPKRKSEENCLCDDVDCLNGVIYEQCEGLCTREIIDCSVNILDEWKYFCEFLNAYLNSTQMSYPVRKHAISIPSNHVDPIRNFFLIMNDLPDRMIANFIATGMFLENMEELHSYFTPIKLKYLRSESIEDYSKVENEGRREYCANWISKNLYLVLLKDFCDQYLNSSSVDEIIEFFEESRSTVADLVDSQDWIPAEEKSTSEKAIRNTKINFYGLKKLLDNETYFKTALSEYTENFQFTKEDFFGNVLQIKRHEKEVHFDSKFEVHSILVEMLADTSFEVEGQFYDYKDGEPVVAMGFGLFFPSYFPGLNKNIKRILLSHTVGHEFGHYLEENLGRDVPNDQRLNKTYFHSTYLNKKLCFEKQFSKFKLNLLNEMLNGSKYLRENIPDSVGVSFMDKMAERYNLSELEFLLPGLPYSTKQLFFIISEQFFCEKEILESEKRYMYHDSHSPPKFRLIGMMQNSREFSNAFDCPVGSYMNPASKCSILD